MACSNLLHEFPLHAVSSESQWSLADLNLNSWTQISLAQEYTTLVYAPSQPITSSQNSVTQTASTPPQPWACPNCNRRFQRRQERDRHLLIHLPYSIYCPSLHCAWRGDRTYGLARHWRNIHANYGPVPQWQQSQIYDPARLVRLILCGALTVEDAASIALSIVALRAMELNKVELWQNGWGRRRFGQ
ncbi:hypothetical protein F5148DRAFT_193588 [Russula earlei]|uniref:Uncharacterized protein n=1 Tax=Russula earlei TaxID=71964 RepID=A0ACC0U5J6_9AGAM|nr:hypothetical protein F5148DRAFT_193588 [Russula earlei]